MATHALRRIPSLDGLRAVSIVLVMLSHSSLNPARRTGLVPTDGPAGTLLNALCNGDLGVSVFFVISGFLITTLLLREVEATGTIRLGDFYTRRAFRIFPAFYAYLFTIFALSWFGAVVFSWPAWSASATFLRNYVAPVEHVVDWYTAHCWSLAVEEQFYLFWPLCMIAVGRRRAVWLAVGLIAVAPVARVATYLLWPDMRRELNYLGHTRVDTLMLGCLAALLFESQSFRSTLRTAYAKKLPFVALLFILFISPWLRRQYHGLYILTLAYGLEATCITLVLLWCIDRPSGFIGRILNSPLVVHIGLISYSVYLWQQLFAPLMLPGYVAATLVAAEGSYWLIERPFLRLRNRFVGGRPLAVRTDDLRSRASSINAS